jgi:ankyrin repeat protein
VTPLIAVAWHCFSDSLRPLFNAGVDVNATDANGHTALDYAIGANTHGTYACNETIRMLQEAGAKRGTDIGQ